MTSAQWTAVIAIIGTIGAAMVAGLFGMRTKRIEVGTAQQQADRKVATELVISRESEQWKRIDELEKRLDEMFQSQVKQEADCRERIRGIEQDFRAQRADNDRRMTALQEENMSLYGMLEAVSCGRTDCNIRQRLSVNRLAVVDGSANNGTNSTSEANTNKSA